MAPTTSLCCYYTCISTHHLLDHKPDNLLRSAGNKFKLNGLFRFGAPGIALIWHYDLEDIAIENFLETLKCSMPQKKFNFIFKSRPWKSNNNDCSSMPITEWKDVSVSASVLKDTLTKIGAPLEDYYTILGLDPPPKQDGGDVANNDNKKKGGIGKGGGGKKNKIKKKK